MAKIKRGKIATVFLLAGFFSIINSCSPVLKLNSGRKIESTCRPEKQFHIFSEYYTLNIGCKTIGRIHTQSNFFKGYNITESVDLIKSGLCALNGNAIKIIDIKAPTPFGSQSYDIIADVLLLDTIPDFNFVVIDNTVKIDSQFCYIQIKRPKRVIGSKGSYPIYIDNEYACSIENDSYTTIKLSGSISSIEVESLGELLPIPIIQKKGFVNDIEFIVGLANHPKFNNISANKKEP